MQILIYSVHVYHFLHFPESHSHQKVWRNLEVQNMCLLFNFYCSNDQFESTLKVFKIIKFVNVIILNVPDITVNRVLLRYTIFQSLSGLLLFTDTDNKETYICCHWLKLFSCFYVAYFYTICTANVIANNIM